MQHDVTLLCALSHLHESRLPVVTGHARPLRLPVAAVSRSGFGPTIVYVAPSQVVTAVASPTPLAITGSHTRLS